MPKQRKLRRAGAVWRLLVHRNIGQGPHSDLAHHVQSDRIAGRENQPDSKTIVLPHTEFDELVVGRWLHVEQMDTGLWWMNIAGVTVHVRADRDGSPLSVRVDGPNDYDQPVDDCAYSLSWDGHAIKDQVYPPDRPDGPATNPTNKE